MIRTPIQIIATCMRFYSASGIDTYEFVENRSAPAPQSKPTGLDDLTGHVISKQTRGPAEIEMGVDRRPRTDLLGRYLPLLIAIGATASKMDLLVCVSSWELCVLEALLMSLSFYLSILLPLPFFPFIAQLLQLVLEACLCDILCYHKNDFFEFYG